MHVLSKAIARPDVKLEGQVFLYSVLCIETLESTICGVLYVTGFRKTDHIVTIDIARNTDLKY